MPITISKIIFFLISVSLFGQQKEPAEFNYKTTYELTWQPDSSNVNATKTEDLLLYIGDDVAKFSSYGKHIKDSLFVIHKADKNKMDLQEYRSQIPEREFRYVIYHNVPEEKINYTKKIGIDKMMYRESIQMDWEIHNESDELLGYKVQKATTSYRGRHYTAWFSEELPFITGPYKFSGLPGLILKIKDKDEDYVFKLKGFEELKEPITHKTELDDFVITDRDKFMELEKEYEHDPFGTLERSGMQFPNMSAKEKAKRSKEYRENRNHENNPIELE